MERSRRHGVVALFTISFLLTAVFAGTARSAPAPAPESMTQSETAAVIAGFEDAMVSDGAFEAYFADSVVLTMVEVNERFVEKQAAHDAMVQLNQIAFNASIRTIELMVGSGIASCEAIFTGVQTGEYEGIPMTRRQVDVPQSIFWKLENGKISSIKIYALVSGIMQQLTSDSYTEPEPIGLTTP